MFIIRLFCIIVVTRLLGLVNVKRLFDTFDVKGYLILVTCISGKVQLSDSWDLILSCHFHHTISFIHHWVITRKDKIFLIYSGLNFVMFHISESVEVIFQNNFYARWEELMFNSLSGHWYWIFYDFDFLSFADIEFKSRFDDKQFTLQLPLN